MKEIVKAEILLTRRCNLRCKYCGIARKGRGEVGIEKWRKGLKSLAKLGCKFVAIYGGEPFLFPFLSDFLKCCNELEMLNSVITNACYFNLLVWERMKELSSLTFSFDSLKKRGVREQRLYVLLDFLEDRLRKKLLRDVEVCCTVSRENYLELPSLIEFFSKKGIWLHFDLIHYSRGQRDSKCLMRDEVEPYLFREEDLEGLNVVIQKVLEMKRSGNYLIHPSERLIEMWLDKGNILGYGWQCSYPHFVSVDCDGSMMVCDDFRDEEVEKIKVWELVDRWTEFEGKWLQAVKRQKCHCFWGTHLDAELIKEGVVTFDSYVHRDIVC